MLNGLCVCYVRLCFAPVIPWMCKVFSHPKWRSRNGQIKYRFEPIIYFLSSFFVLFSSSIEFEREHKRHTIQRRIRNGAHTCRGDPNRPSFCWHRYTHPHCSHRIYFDALSHFRPLILSICLLHRTIINNQTVSSLSIWVYEACVTLLE